VYCKQLLKSSSDNATIRFEYSVPLSVKTTDDDAPVEEQKPEVTKEQSEYVTEMYEIENDR